MIKRVPVFLMLIVLLSGVVLAESISIEFPLGDTFKAGEAISLKVSVLDDQNNPIDDDIQLTLVDSEKRKTIEKTVPSRRIVNIDLGENALNGFWTVTAKHNGVESKELFTVETEELAKFEIHGDKLTITNIGNTKYSKTVQIVIGDTIGIKNPEIEVGKNITFRLVAPEGTYNIKVTDGSTTIQRSNVALTGNVVGVLDERIINGNTLTGDVKPQESLTLNYLKSNKIIYVFVFAIFGATILLAIERHYRRKLN